LLYPKHKIPNSTLPDKRRRCSKDATYALENSNSISEYTSAAIVASGSSLYPITRQAREKNPKKQKNKEHPLSEIYLYDPQEKNQ
jgi:hypothetical protein